uniref:Uncharacterized protein n=1 Tax=Panagrolaimus superbus TaxID=310955 RepID=A0A914Z2K4_9BILA
MIPLTIIVAEFFIYGSLVTIFLIFGCAKLKGLKGGGKPADTKPTTPAIVPVPNTTTAVPAPPTSAAPNIDKNTVSMQPTEDPDLKSRENYDIKTTDETYISKIKTQKPPPPAK